jgi:hypothetical protein
VEINKQLQHENSSQSTQAKQMNHMNSLLCSSMFMLFFPKIHECLIGPNTSEHIFYSLSESTIGEEGYKAGHIVSETVK